jgi:hypothetical protein
LTEAGTGQSGEDDTVARDSNRTFISARNRGNARDKYTPIGTLRFGWTAKQD